MCFWLDRLGVGERIGQVARTMLVTCPSGGIGAAVVRVAADRGYRVMALGRDAARLDQVCVGVPGTSPVLLDLRRPTGLPEPLASLDRLDAVVHCAAATDVASVEETSYSMWLETLTVNVAAAAELTRALLPALRKAVGHVVFINAARSEEHTSELQSHHDLVCRLL